MSESPIRVLQRIQAATEINAAPMPLSENVEPEWQGIGFQLGGVRLVSPMGEVNELLQLPKTAALPGVKSWVLGIANIRGKLIPIVDLHQFLGLEPTLPQSQWRVLVVEDGDMTAGFLVEQSLGIQHFLLSSFEPPGADVPAVLGPFVRGVYRHGGRVYYEGRLKSILRDERFFDVAEGDMSPSEATSV